MDNESKQHYKMYKSGKQWVYAGLATITMISGMGATPVILADELVADKTEATTKDDKDVTEDKAEVTADEKDADNKVENAPEVAAETPKPLPDNKVTLAPVKNEAPVAGAGKTVAVTPPESIVKKSETIKKTAKTVSKETVANTESVKTKKAKDSRADVAHKFTIDDFVVTGGNTITGFSASFKASVYPTWDGDFTLDGSYDTRLNAITTIADFAFSNGGETGGDPKIQNITFKNLTGLTTIKYSFEGCVNLESASFINLQSLQHITNRAFGDEQSLTSVVFDGLPAMVEADAYGFVNNHKVTNLTFSNMPNLTEIGSDTFGNDYALQTLNLNTLPNLTTIDLGAFANNGLTSLILDGLPKLTTIGQNAFSSSVMETVTLRNLPLLETIEANAFNLNYSFEKLIIGNLPSLDADGIDHEAFTEVQSGGVVVPDRGQTDLALANAFVGKINDATYNQFVNRTSEKTGTNSMNGHVWYVQAAVQYKFVDESGNPLADPTTDSRTGVVRIGDIINLNPDATPDVNTRYDAMPAKTIAGYTLVPEKTTVTNTNILGNGNANMIDSLTPEPTVTYVYSQNPIKTGSVTYEYIDQDGKVILVDANGVPIDPYYKGGNEGDTYNPKDGVPLIPGYGKPEWVSGAETGVIGDGDITIVYRYHKKADPITIYRVDTNDTPLADPEVVTDTYVDDILDLGAKQRTFSGYDFIELYNSAPVVQKAMTDFTWLNDHSSIGTKLTFEANAGRNYKFVYGKKATTPTTPTTPPTLPVTGETPTTPAKSPSTSGNKTPGGLPVTGDDKNPSNKSGSNTTNPGTVTNISNATPSVNSTPTGTLPKSGNAVNRLLPAIGATLLASLIGLFAFRKQHK